MNIYNKKQLIELVEALPECATLHVNASVHVSTSDREEFKHLLSNSIHPDIRRLDNFDGEIHVGFYCESPKS